MPTAKKRPLAPSPRTPSGPSKDIPPLASDSEAGQVDATLNTRGQGDGDDTEGDQEEEEEVEEEDDEGQDPSYAIATKTPSTAEAGPSGGRSKKLIRKERALKKAQDIREWTPDSDEERELARRLELERAAKRGGNRETTPPRTQEPLKKKEKRVLTKDEELKRIEKKRKKRYVDASIPLFTIVDQGNDVRRKMVFWFSEGFDDDHKEELEKAIIDNGGLVTEVIWDCDYPLVPSGHLNDLAPVIDKINLKGMTAVSWIWVTDSIKKVIKLQRNKVTRKQERPPVNPVQNYFRNSRSAHQSLPIFSRRDSERWENGMDDDDKTLVKGLKKRSRREFTYQALFEHLGRKYQHRSRKSWEKKYSKNWHQFDRLGLRRAREKGQVKKDEWESDTDEEVQPEEAAEADAEADQAMEEEQVEEERDELEDSELEDLETIIAQAATSSRSPPKPAQPAVTQTLAKRRRGRSGKDQIAPSQPQPGPAKKSRKAAAAAAPVEEEEDELEAPPPAQTRAQTRQTKEPSEAFVGFNDDIFSHNLQMTSQAEADKRVGDRARLRRKARR